MGRVEEAVEDGNGGGRETLRVYTWYVGRLATGEAFGGGEGESGRDMGGRLPSRPGGDRKKKGYIIVKLLGLVVVCQSYLSCLSAVGVFLCVTGCTGRLRSKNASPQA